MADPALDPHNPDNAGGPEAEDAARTADPSPASTASPMPDTHRPDLQETGLPETGTPEDAAQEAPDLESQVEDLLAEVSETVDEIHRKLSDDAPPEYTDIEDVENELAAFADDAPEGSMIGVETDAESPAETPVEATAEHSTTNELGEGHGPAETLAEEPGPQQPTGEDTAPRGSAPDDGVAAESIEDIQAALEDAIGDPAIHENETIPEPASSDGAPIAEEPAAEEPADGEPVEEEAVAAEETLAAEAVAAESDSEQTPTGEVPDEVPDDAQAEDPASATGRAPADQPLIKDPDAPAAESDSETDPDAPPDYTDAGSLDDELAALAADALGDDDSFLEEPPAEPETIERAAIEPAAIEPGAPDPASADAGESADTPDDPQPISLPTDLPTDTDADTAAAKEQPTPEPAPAIPSEAVEPKRPGWLPPKPEWPEVYSRWRPLVIAWRHAAWIVPPFLVFVWSTGWAWLMPRAKSTAMKAEPHLRLAIAKAATPLSKRDEKTRSIIGWFAIYTLFVSACLWVYILVGRSPVAPTPDTPETSLARETATADANN